MKVMEAPTQPKGTTMTTNNTNTRPLITDDETVILTAVSFTSDHGPTLGKTAEETAALITEDLRTVKDGIGEHVWGSYQLAGLPQATAHIMGMFPGATLIAAVSDHTDPQHAHLEYTAAFPFGGRSRMLLNVMITTSPYTPTVDDEADCPETSMIIDVMFTAGPDADKFTRGAATLLDDYFERRRQLESSFARHARLVEMNAPELIVENELALQANI